MSMQAIREWGEKHSEAEVRELLEQMSRHPSSPQILRLPQRTARPLIGRASVASDCASFRPARPVLVKSNGKFSGQC